MTQSDRTEEAVQARVSVSVVYQHLRSQHECTRNCAGQQSEECRESTVDCDGDTETRRHKRYRERETHRATERDTHTHTQRETHTHTHTNTHTHTHTQIARESPLQRHGDRAGGRGRQAPTLAQHTCVRMQTSRTRISFAACISR